jgi:hypothetical protein
MLAESRDEFLFPDGPAWADVAVGAARERE